MTFENLLGGIAPTLLPADPALDELIQSGSDHFVQVASHHLDSSLCWAILSEGSLAAGTPDANLIAYGFARTGYHRGLDTLRKNGWRGSGPVPWEHEPNRGFLRSLAMLAALSDRLGDDTESDRCWQFLRDCSPTAYEVLHARSTGPASAVADLVRDITSPDENEEEPEGLPTAPSYEDLLDDVEEFPDTPSDEGGANRS